MNKFNKLFKFDGYNLLTAYAGDLFSIKSLEPRILHCRIVHCESN